MQIGELKVRLGVDADTFKIKDFVRELGNIPFTVAAGITSLTGMSLALTDLGRNTLDLSNNLSLFTAETGLSASELQRWTAVAREMGLSGDVVQGSVMGIARALANLRLGIMDEGFMRALGMMHISTAGKTPFQIMQAAGAWARNIKNPTLAGQVLNMAHISPEMLKIFDLSRAQFDQRAARGVVLNTEQVKALNDLQVSLADFKTSVEKDFAPVMIAAIPAMKDLAATLADFVKYAVAPAAKAAVGVTHNKFFREAMEGLSVLIPGSRANREAVGKVYNSVVNLTNHIQSTADAEGVADFVNEFTVSYHRRAMKAFNNGGR